MNTFRQFNIKRYNYINNVNVSSNVIFCSLGFITSCKNIIAVITLAWLIMEICDVVKLKSRKQKINPLKSDLFSVIRLKKTYLIHPLTSCQCEVLFLTKQSSYFMIKVFYHGLMLVRQSICPHIYI